MMMQNQTLTPSELIRRVAEETQCLMDMRRESMENGDLPDIPEEQDEIIQLYGKRWDIEVFFKTSKSVLRLTAYAGPKLHLDRW